jgi:hypothetical protein
MCIFERGSDPSDSLTGRCGKGQVAVAVCSTSFVHSIVDNRYTLCRRKNSVGFRCVPFMEASVLVLGGLRCRQVVSFMGASLVWEYRLSTFACIRMVLLSCCGGVTMADCTLHMLRFRL